MPNLITVNRSLIKMNNTKKLSCRRETVWCFLSLNILLSHSRSFETTLLS